MPNTLTTQSPGQPPHTRPVPPSWPEVASLLERWQMALVPHPEGLWDVLAGESGHGLPMHEAHRVPFAQLPQAIAALAARCAGAG